MRSRSHWIFFWLPLWILFLHLASTNGLTQFETPEVAKAQAFLSVDKIRIGDEFKIGIKAKIDPEWHINSNKPTDEFLIPTVVEMDPVEGLEFGGMFYPEGLMKKFAFSPEPLSVYESEVLIWSKVRALPSLKPTPKKITGKFKYQACNDVYCLAPTAVEFELPVIIVNPDVPVFPRNEDQFQAGTFELGQLQGDRTPAAENQVSALIEGKGFLVTLVFVFLGGLALNLTPCVYPLIPITISYFGGQTSGGFGKSLFLAATYVFGMAITYSSLGVGAALSGGLLGSSLQNPIVLLVIASVFLVFAASMFGAFEIRIPAFLLNFAGGSRQGVFGALFMGLTVGIVAAPCIGPFVLSLLTYVAARGDAAIGFLMFFVLSLGLGLPFLILGTFSGLIKNLPRSGEWMVWIKKVFGVVMIAVAFYFISTLIPELAYIVVITVVAVLGGVFVGFLDKSTASLGGFKFFKFAIGTAMILFGVWTSLAAWQDANKEKINWQNYNEALVAEAEAQGKPVLIDFYADWCIPCKQIDKTLFVEPTVVAKSADFLTLKADLTKETSEGVKAIRKKYRVVGVPTVIVLDSRGNEYRRFTDELLNLAPERFVEIMNEAL
ncbi:thioredoxin family protein [bacterium]|nr:thioredoxin family protein [bacterium]